MSPRSQYEWQAAGYWCPPSARHCGHFVDPVSHRSVRAYPREEVFDIREAVFVPLADEPDDTETDTVPGI